MIGRTLDSWTLQDRLGRGGMGTVYLARHPTTGQQVAVKVLAESLSADPQVLQRFELEYEIVSRLDHPRIVRGHGGVRSAQDAVYFVMDYVPGANLQRILRALGRLTPAEVVHIGRQLCEALAFAHARGIVHRDLKPSNLLIDAAGDLHVTDFGLAHVSEVTRMTFTGQVLGTPEYMSPEQAAGRPTEARSDLYSAGVVLYEMATGAPPFNAENPLAVLRKHCDEAPVPPDVRNPELPPTLVRAILSCLEKDPLRRPESAADLLLALDAAIPTSGSDPRRRFAETVHAGSGGATRPYLAPITGRLNLPPVGSDGKRVRRIPAWTVGLAGAVVLTTGALALQSWGPGDPSAARAGATTTNASEAEITLSDGSTRFGQVISIRDGEILLRDASGAEIRTPLATLRGIRYGAQDR